jgi:hypothetical protein
MARRLATIDVASDDVVDEALRRCFGLRGIAVLDELREQRRGPELTDDAAMALAVTEVQAARAERRNAS